MDENSRTGETAEAKPNPILNWMQEQAGAVDYIHDLYPDQMDPPDAETPDGK